MEIMMLPMDDILTKIKDVKGFEKVRFIILFGSAAEGRMSEGSDIYLCVYYDGSPEEASRFRLNVLSELFEDVYDVHIFQQLPLYVRLEVLKGKVVYCKDIKFVYEVALETIKDFEEFKYHYYDYIGERALT